MPRPIRLAAALLGLALSAAPAARAAEPVDAVGRVDVLSGHSLEMCSGTLIRPDLVLTAAHCVADPKDGYARPIEGMVFLAGWSVAGHAGAARVAGVEVHPDAFDGGRLDIAHDLALISLARPIDVQGLRIGVSAAGGPFTILGYGGDAPDRLARDNDCQGREDGPLWRLGCPIRKGQSGGPVLFGEGDAQRVVAVMVATTEEASYAVPVDGWLRRAIATTR